MMPRVLWSSLLLLVASCGGMSRATATAGPVPPGLIEHSASERYPTNTFVLIWFDAPMYKGLDDSNPARAYDFGGDPRTKRPGHFFTMQVLEDRGEWLRVTDPHEWLRENDGSSIHCIGSGAFWVEHFAIELWVKQADLVPVLTDTFSNRADDATFVDLFPGTPVIDGRPWAEGYHFPLVIPAESVGSRYKPLEFGSAAEDREGFSLVNSDDAKFSFGGYPVEWRQEITDYAKSPYFRVAEDRTRSYESGGCGAFELAFNGHMFGTKGGGYGTAESSQKKVDGIEIPKGTPLFWPSGASAGSVVEAFRQGGSRRSDSARTCLEVPLGTNLRTTGYLNESVTVCVESSAVRAVKTTPPMPKRIRSADNSIRILD